MECRSFQVTLISARNLLNVRHIGRMKVYAKISINGYSDSERTCPVDKDRKTNPYWNFQVRYAIPEEAVQQEGDNLVIKLYCQRSFKEDKYVGELKFSLKQLFDGALARKNIVHPVSRNDAPGQKFGTLKLSYRFGSTTKHAQEKFNSSTGRPGPSMGGQGPWKGFFVLSVIADGLQIGTALFDGAQYLYKEFYGEEEEEAEEEGEGEEGEEGEEAEEGEEEVEEWEDEDEEW